MDGEVGPEESRIVGENVEDAIQTVTKLSSFWDDICNNCVCSWRCVLG